MSSANNTNFPNVAVWRVTNVSVKKSGPNTDPWWTPQALSKQDHMSSPSSDCCLLSRELLSRVRTPPLVPHCSPLLIHLSWSIVSNAFFRSINTQLHISFGLSSLWFLQSVQWLLQMLICWIWICIDCQSVNRVYWWICSVCQQRVFIRFSKVAAAEKQAVICEVVFVSSSVQRCDFC